MPSLCFVCTLNVCRSPFAAVLLPVLLEKYSPGATTPWRVESAGTWAREGDTVPARLQLVAREWNLDLSRHRSRCVSRELLRRFNLVLVMEQGHREALRVEYPDLASRVFLLSEMVGVTLNVVDPVNGSLADYRLMANEISRWLKLGTEQIVRRAQVPMMV